MEFLEIMALILHHMSMQHSQLFSHKHKGDHDYTRKMLNHLGASLSEQQIAFEIPIQTCNYSSSWTTMATWALPKHHELTGESLLCMGGHARHVPEASAHPAVCHQGHL